MEIKIITANGTHTVTGFSIADGHIVQLDDVSRMRIKDSENAIRFEVADSTLFLELE